MFFGFNKKKKGKQNSPGGGDDREATQEFENKVNKADDVLSNIDELLKQSENLSKNVTQEDVLGTSCGC